MKRRAIPRGILAACLFLLAAATAARAIDPLPAPEGVEDARRRLQYLQKGAESVDAWVEWNWGVEFDRRNQGLSRDPKQGSGETEQAWKERLMKVRIATSEVKGRLRTERAEWVAREKERLLKAEIAEPLPVRLGPYDEERKRFPLLLGFGWPSGLAIGLRIPDAGRKEFEARFPKTLPATFRINEQGEVHLLSIEKCWEPGVHDVYVAPPGPRLAWEASHASWVTSVAFRADGSQVLSTGADSKVACRDADSGNPLFVLDKVEMASSVAWSPDGSLFATGGTDSVLRVRSGTDGKEIWKAEAKGMVMTVAFSPDGRHVAAGDDAGFLKVYHAETGEERFKVAAETPVRSIDFTRGGRGIVVGGEANRVLLWDFGSDKIVWRKKVEWPVYAVASNPAGGTVAIGGGGTELEVLREADGTEEWSARTEGEVRALRFDPSGRLLASGGAGYTAKVFHSTGGSPVWSAAIGSPIRSLAFGADGRKLFVGSADGGLRMFHIDEAERVQAFFGAPGRVYLERKRVESLFR
jgi:outer membrane protein assembly factor BamB